LKRIEELDGLRAIAILGVFSCHFARQYSRSFEFLGLGWAGVDLFFAISGFLITSVLIGLREQDAAYQTFYWRRMLRIFPPYYLALTLILVLAFIHHEHLVFRETIRYWLFLSSAKYGLMKAALARLLVHQNLVLPPPSSASRYYVPQFKNWLAIYWSLSIEELFYLVWAPVILRGSRRTILFFSAAPLVICPILRGLVHTPSFGEAYGFLFRFDSLAAGGLVALLLLAAGRGNLSGRLFNRGLVITVIFSSLSLVLLTWYWGIFRIGDVRSTLAFSVFGYTLLAILCASVVGVCVRWSGSLSVFFRLLRSKSAIYLGTISYTMYLIHMPVYVFFQLMLLKYLGTSNALVLDMNNGLLLLLGILTALCTIVAASLSWRYFETPILRFKDRQFSPLARRRSRQTRAEAATL
jgi:peptidoglycan/LPS O-acetylase OafA/YrhL